MKLTPLHPRFGVEVQDFPLAAMTPERFAPLRAAFEEHSLLLFRNQDFGEADHMALANLFGPIEDRNIDSRPKGEAFKIPEVSNIREDGTLTGEMDMHTLHLKANMLWHCDSTFLPAPALTNILVARVVTATGGATEFASARAGWADMPEELKTQIRGRMVRHRYAHSRAKINPELAQLPMFHKWPDQLWRAVWKNPVNGREALYLASHACAVEGMEPEAGLALIERLLNFVTQPDYVFSHTWNVGDVLVWDQRCVLHRATPWNYDEPRKLTSICTSVTVADGIEEMKAA